MHSTNVDIFIFNGIIYAKTIDTMDKKNNIKLDFFLLQLKLHSFYLHLISLLTCIFLLFFIKFID